MALRENFEEHDCSVARTLGVVGERWTLLVVREAFYGARRFDEFRANLGIARNILSDRLRGLVEAGILTREPYQQHPERFEYRLTDKGHDLYPALIALMRWGDKHMADDDGPPLVLEHKECGRETFPVLACSACGEAITARDVRPSPRRPGLVRLTNSR